MRQNLHHFVRIHRPLAHWNIFHRHQRGLVGTVRLVESLSEKQVQPVTGFRRQNMRPNRHGEQSQIPHDVQNLVPNEFVWVAERFFTHDRLATNHDGVFQTPTLNQSLC